MRRLIGGIAFGLLAAAALPSDTAKAEEDAATWLVTTAVKRFVDGDTFVTEDGVRVRVWGIAAPELGTPLGDAVRDAMNEVLALWKEEFGDLALACRIAGVSYGRIVAQCSYRHGGTDGLVDLGAVIVGLGLARDCPAYSGGVYARFEKPEAVRSMELPPYCVEE